MSNLRPDAVPSLYIPSWDRLCEYIREHSRTLDVLLGYGADGVVYSTTLKTAIKAFRYQRLYENEKNVYLRLADRGVSSIDSFDVPRMLNFSDAHWMVEMSIVSPPFILDFAGATLDSPPQWDDERMEEWQQEKAEQFGDRWDEVTSALATLRGLGIYMNDVKPGNVTFPPDGSESLSG